MPEEKSGPKIAIIVAVITLVGVLGTAIIGNIDKIRNAISASRLSEVCPKVDGVWQRKWDNATIVISQSDCDISGSIKSAGFDHEVQGKFHTDGGYFECIVKRTDLSNGCVAEMYDKLQKIDQNQIRIIVSGTDGRCGLAMNYPEDHIWLRQ